MKRTLVILLSGFVFWAGIISAYAEEVDDQIKSSIEKSYVYKSYLKDDRVSVKSEDGVVTLSGSVEDQSHKSLAEETAKETPAVVRVDNNLEVKAQAGPEGSDGWTGVKVKSVLFLNRHVSAINTQVSVKDGVVILRGEAGSQAQKDLTTEYAKEVEGVKDVKNMMRVVSPDGRASLGNHSENEGEKTAWGEHFGEAIDDASITAQVKLALLWNRSTSGLKTGVKTDNETVTLSGKAKNQAEIDLATKIANDIRGVKNVVNHMTVE